MSGAVIYWWNVGECEREYEEFESLGDAMTELDKWTIKYPWNTYRVASVVHTRAATQKQPQRYADWQAASADAAPQAEKENTE